MSENLQHIKRLEAELEASRDLLAVARLQAKSYKKKYEEAQDYIKKELSKS